MDGLLITIQFVPRNAPTDPSTTRWTRPGARQEQRITMCGGGYCSSSLCDGHHSLLHSPSGTCHEHMTVSFQLPNLQKVSNVLITPPPPNSRRTSIEEEIRILIQINHRLIIVLLVWLLQMSTRRTESLTYGAVVTVV